MRVLLDVALASGPFAADSVDVLRWAEAGGAAVAWHSLTSCAYLLKGGGRPFLERLLRLVEVAPVATADVPSRRAFESYAPRLAELRQQMHAEMERHLSATADRPSQT